MAQVTKDLVAAGWRVEAEGKLIRPAGEFKLALATGIDWFELEGGIDYGDQRVSLPELLAAARRGESMIELGDGSMGMLPEEWLKKYGMLADLATDATTAASASASAGRHARRAPGGPAGDPGRRRLREGPAEPPAVRGDRGARLAAGLPRRASPLSARGAGLARLPPAVRVRRHPGRRHGPGQDDPGPGAPAAAAGPPPGQGPVAGRRPPLAGLQLGPGGRQVHPAAPRARLHRPRPPRPARDVPRLRSDHHHLRHRAYRYRRADASSSSTTRSSTKPRRSRTPRASRPRPPGCCAAATSWRSAARRSRTTWASSGRSSSS